MSRVWVVPESGREGGRVTDPNGHGKLGGVGRRKNVEEETVFAAPDGRVIVDWARRPVSVVSQLLRERPGERHSQRSRRGLRASRRVADGLDHGHAAHDRRLGELPPLGGSGEADSVPGQR